MPGDVFSMTSLDAALQWRALGIACIPILAGSKRPALESWHQYQSELPSEAKLRAWFSVEFNLAVLLGWRNLAVVDFDNLDVFEQWQAEHDPLDTYRVQTARGWHLYVYTEEETCTWHGEGVDVKGKSSYVLGPPSIHPSGWQYRGYGSPELIATIASIKDLLPEYEPPALIAHTSRPADPYDMAMRQECGISVASIKATWRWEDVLSVNGTARRGVMMVNCPFHQDDHASMALYPDKHAFCYGCQYRGDLIDVFAALHNLTVQEAMREMRK